MILTINKYCGVFLVYFFYLFFNFTQSYCIFAAGTRPVRPPVRPPRGGRLFTYLVHNNIKLVFTPHLISTFS